MEARRAGTRLRRAAAATVLVGMLLAPGVAAAEAPRPTADPAAPTPTSPYPGRPPQGSAPDGSTVGGEDLDTRGTVVDEDAPPLPAGLAANGWLVADAGTGTVLAAKDPHGRFYPASTLKTLTLLTLLPELDPDEVVTATARHDRVPARLRVRPCPMGCNRMRPDRATPSQRSRLSPPRAWRAGRSCG